VSNEHKKNENNRKKLRIRRDKKFRVMNVKKGKKKETKET
jgi:hypothetical protein